MSSIIFLFVFLFAAVPLFAESERRSPENPKQVYNHGVTLAAEGKLDDAAAELQKTAVVRDEKVAAPSLALLGHIAVDKVKQTLAKNPAETEPNKRKECLEYLESAEKYYSESFSVQKLETTAKALEQIRAWRSKITSEWDNTDRENKRQSETLERLNWIAEEQESVKNTVEPEILSPDSPKKFQMCYENTKKQQKIAEETGLVKEETENGEEKTENDTSGKPWDTPLKLLPEIQNLMEEAADELSKNKPAQALPKQQKALELLREILKQQNPQNQNQEQQQNQDNKQEQQNQNKDGQDKQNEDEQKHQKNEAQKKQEQDEQKQEPQKNEENASNKGSDEKQAREKAEQRLRQVRRRQQEANERRERIKVLLMQSEPAEKDW